MTRSIRTTLIRRINLILITTFIAVLSIVAVMIIYIANSNLKNSEKQLFQALLTKGNTLILNNSQAMIEMASDNSFSAIDKLVSSTVRNDDDIVYGIFMDTALRPWTLVYHSQNQENNKAVVLKDPLSKWAASLKQSHYIKIEPELSSYYSLSGDNSMVYEFASPVFEVLEQDEINALNRTGEKQLLGTIRYGISTFQLENARSEAKLLTKKVMSFTLLILFILGCIAIYIAYIAIRYTATLITQPLAELSQATIDISQGNYDSPVIIDCHNEVGVLSQSFDLMRIKIKQVLEQLLQHQNDLKEKNKHLQRTQNELENLNQHLEDKVNERTKELKAVQEELLKTARAAGMAEIAINVLHNIGNVINSVNVSNQDNYTTLRNSRISSFVQTNELIAQHQADIAHFLNHDPRGQKIPELLNQLGNALNRESQTLLENSKRINHCIGIIANIIANQQKYAKNNLYIETLDLKAVIIESLDIQRKTLDKNSIQLSTDLATVPTISADRAKIHQILTNLLINAMHAMENNPLNNRLLNVKLIAEQQFLNIIIKDNGCGISEKLLTDIFQHGFTTKENGNGFGLHSCANLATELGGQIEAHSEGIGKGATFIIKLKQN